MNIAIVYILDGLFKVTVLSVNPEATLKMPSYNMLPHACYIVT